MQPFALKHFALIVESRLNSLFERDVLETREVSKLLHAFLFQDNYSLESELALSKSRLMNHVLTSS